MEKIEELNQLNNENIKNAIQNVVIIGSGPAGYTAAIYCARALLQPLLITGLKFGGLLMQTTDVDNFPGFPNGINGPELMESFHLQADRFGTQFIIDDVKSVDLTNKPFKLTLFSGGIVNTKSIIIATGSSPLWLNAEGETDLRGYGVSTCAVCDANFFKGEDIVVVGGGDSAISEAIYLTNFANKVTIIHRRNEFRTSKILLEQAKSNTKIFFKTPFVIKQWLCDITAKLDRVLLQNTEDGTEEILNCSGGFLAIGHKPNTSFLNNQLETDSNGYILKKNKNMTSVEGVFCCGDIADTVYKQAITAAGDGCKCALDVIKYLETN